MTVLKKVSHAASLSTFLLISLLFFQVRGRTNHLTDCKAHPAINNLNSLLSTILRQQNNERQQVLH
jgi:hypothetical protein